MTACIRPANVKINAFLLVERVRFRGNAAARKITVRIRKRMTTGGQTGPKESPRRGKLDTKAQSDRLQRNRATVSQNQRRRGDVFFIAFGDDKFQAGDECSHPPGDI